MQAWMELKQLLLYDNEGITAQLGAHLEPEGLFNHRISIYMSLLLTRGNICVCFFVSGVLSDSVAQDILSVLGVVGTPRCQVINHQSFSAIAPTKLIAFLFCSNCCVRCWSMNHTATRRVQRRCLALAEVCFNSIY
jgi:hypothetical protein